MTKQKRLALECLLSSSDPACAATGKDGQAHCVCACVSCVCACVCVFVERKRGRNERRLLLRLFFSFIAVSLHSPAERQRQCRECMRRFVFLRQPLQ